MSDRVIMAAPTASNHLQNMLQRAVKTVQWTYTIYWRLCPLQRLLVWGDGYYNGEIKTRKTVQLKETSNEEASLERSQQLRELYDMLCATGETDNHQTRKLSTALLPEDLTEPEWFYLMSFSYSFSPGTGLPGKTYANRQHVWLTGANEVDGHTFSRAILAKSACIQTVVCIPLLDGVVEVGTTERVEQDLGFIQHMTSFFINVSHHDEPRFIHPSTEPALLEHSTSNHQPPTSPIEYITTTSGHQVADQTGNEDDKEEEVVGAESPTQSSDFMHELIRSLDYGSNNYMDSNIYYHHNILNTPTTVQIGNQDATTISLEEFELHALLISSSGGGISCVNDELLLPMQELAADNDTHYYYQTLAAILQHQSNISVSPAVIHRPSGHSAFFKWSSTGSGIRSTSNYHLAAASMSQRKLKYILFIKPPFHLHNSHSTSFTNPTSREEDQINCLENHHDLSERRRREKLNERFVILRSLLPFNTKVDKATVLGDAIEYVKQLRNRIQEIEQRQEPPESSMTMNMNHKKKITTEGKGKCKAGCQQPPEEVHVEVSIIDNDALVEMQCPYREGLLTDVVQMLRQRLEITDVQSSLSDGHFVAELRAKVKENVKGRKATIMEVKKAIHQTVACGIAPSKIGK